MRARLVSEVHQLMHAQDVLQRPGITKSAGPGANAGVLGQHAGGNAHRDHGDVFTGRSPPRLLAGDVAGVVEQAADLELNPSRVQLPDTREAGSPRCNDVRSPGGVAERPGRHCVDRYATVDHGDEVAVRN